MVGSLLLRGMLVGLVAALLAFAFARVYGEPSVERAIALEVQAGGQAGGGQDGMAAGHGSDAGSAEASAAAEPEEELVSRPTQAGIGLFTGVVAYGAALGGIFALVFAFAHGRIAPVGPRGTAALIALVGFVAVVLVPFLKYPANPPAVGSAETIGMRTQFYFLMLLSSVLAMVAAVAIAMRVRSTYGAMNAAIAAGATFLVLTAIAYLSLPLINEVPDSFPSDLLWKFRAASLGIHAILWTVLGIGFGLAAERLMRPVPRRPAALGAR